MSASFDLISDLHADFWLTQRNLTLQENVDLFVGSLLPTNPSKVLVIAGDLGHHNRQSNLLLMSFRRKYDHVLVVLGNHDYYLVNSSERWKNNNRSRNRRNNLKELASQIDGVTLLDGSQLTIDGITYAGTGMWHDFSFGVEQLCFSEHYLYEIWQRSMNDSELILPKLSLHMLRSFFEEEFDKLQSIFKKSQVIVTHVSPDAEGMPSKHRNDPVSTFYYFDGSKLLSTAKNKVWCYGHTHTRADYLHKDGCRLINNALGYPVEKNGTKIKTIEL